MKISVIGSGSFGTALAMLLTNKGHDVTIYGRNSAQMAMMRATRGNHKYLPGIILPEALKTTDDLKEALTDAELAVLAVPAQNLRPVLKEISGIRQDLPMVNVAKGIEIGTLKRGEDVVRDDEVIRCADAAYEPWEPRSFAYCSDTAPFPELAGWVRGVDLMYHEATYTAEHADLAEKRHHSTTLQAAQCALDAGAKRLVIGHYSSRERNASVYEAECRTVFPETYAASDGSVYDIPLVKKD